MTPRKDAYQFGQLLRSGDPEARAVLATTMADGNKTRAARELGVSRITIIKWCKECGL